MRKIVLFLSLSMLLFMSKAVFSQTESFLKMTETVSPKKLTEKETQMMIQESYRLYEKIHTEMKDAGMPKTEQGYKDALKNPKIKAMLEELTALDLKVSQQKPSVELINSAFSAISNPACMGCIAGCWSAYYACLENAGGSSIIYCAFQRDGCLFWCPCSNNLTLYIQSTIPAFRRVFL
ncbi:MAG TPA: hypothetical protein PLQ20_02585 [Candidatus Paceibacterota bacterium]|nr:hypothetical protein [Candidatus Paceibacterota bacterium]